METTIPGELEAQRDEAAAEMLRAWRDLRDVKELYAHLFEVRGGRPEGPPTSEVALLIRRLAIDLRAAVERHEELAAEVRRLAPPASGGAR